jgi:RNA polymerase sigma-70 factor, ECF subfamily
VKGRETEWAALMRAARAGDASAYDRCLRAMAIALRPVVRRGLARSGRGDDTEDVVQEILLAVHLKRQSWDETRPIGPWIAAIARYKVIDALRRRGRRIDLPIEEFSNSLAAEEVPADPSRAIARALATLPVRQRGVLQRVAADGASITETAATLGMTEGAVRVALHRGLVTLAKQSRQTDED